MNRCGVPFWLAVCSLALSLAAAVSWLAQPWTGSLSPQLSALLYGGTTALALIAVTRICVRWRRQLAQGKHAIQGLLARPEHDFQDEKPPTISLPADHPWRDVLMHVAERYHSLAHRLQESEDARAALQAQLRKQAAEHERASLVLSSLNVPVLVVDEYGELVQANPSAERLFNFNADEAYRRAIKNITRCEQLLDLLNDTQRRKSHTTRQEEIQLPGPDGMPRWHEVTACSFTSEAAKEAEALAASDSGVLAHSQPSQGAVVVLRDITSQKAAQQRYAEFVSAVSHEMKTPLASIKAYVELLVDGDAEDDETREEFLNVINSQTDRLHRLIDNVLNLARIESGVVEIHKVSQPLNSILTEAYETVKPAAEAKNITLVSALSPLYLPVLADHDQMLQAAINLLSNAVKYTPEGGTITLRSRDLDGQVQFEVEDTGVGLSPENCERIFDRFYRVKKDTHMASGTGLGLPLAKTIVEDMHGGRISVRSTLGEGSTFIVTLPSAAELG